MGYSRVVTRTHRTLFVIAVDQSGSMLGLPKGKNRDLSRAEIAAMTASMLVDELIYKSSRFDEVRDYYDVALIGYSAGEVRSLLDDKLYTLPIPIINSRRATKKQIIYNIDGQLAPPKLVRTYVAEWVEPTAYGRTAVVEMLNTVYNLVSDWCNDPKNCNSFPPIVVNITDESRIIKHSAVRQLIEQITSLGTTDGRAIVLNICIDQTVESSNSREPYSDLRGKRIDNLPELLLDCFTRKCQRLENTITDSQPLILSYDTSLFNIMQLINIGSYSRPVDFAESAEYRPFSEEK